MSGRLNEEEVLRGPELRAKPSPELRDALANKYGLAIAGEPTDLGGSSNLNLLMRSQDDEKFVVRVYRPWVTAARLEDIQLARRTLNAGGVPSPIPVSTRDGRDSLVIGGRLLEVERFVEHDADMDSWERLEAGLPLLGVAHSLLATLQVSLDGRRAPAANHVDSAEALAWTHRGTQEIRRWDASPDELRLADASEELARLVVAAERELIGELPRQLVHGDFWDNNVFFRDDDVVLVTDLDFMGERSRIDDLALTLYYTNSTFHEDQVSGQRIGRLRTLVRAYESGLATPLSAAERTALPLAIARTPLCFVGMIASQATQEQARSLAAELTPDIGWALAMVRDAERWQEGLSSGSG